MDFKEIPLSSNAYIDCECIICMQSTLDTEYVLLNCNHLYHYHCIKKWKQKHNTCPMCRQKIDFTDATLFEIQTIDEVNPAEEYLKNFFLKYCRCC